MSVVDNSSNSSGNNYGKGNGNDYDNDKGKGIDNNESSNKRKFYENNDVNNNKDSGNSNVKRTRLDGVVSEQMTSSGVGNQIILNENTPDTNYPLRATTETSLLQECFKD
jgi:hypothetical protein